MRLDLDSLDLIRLPTNIVAAIEASPIPVSREHMKWQQDVSYHHETTKKIWYIELKSFEYVFFSRESIKIQGNQNLWKYA